MGFDLTGVQAFLETLMADTTVRVTRGGWRQEADLDEDTGELQTFTPHAMYVGPGLLQPLGAGEVADPQVQRIVERTAASYRLLLPAATVTEFLAGDDVDVTVSPDPMMLTRMWKLVELADVGSIIAARVLYLRQTDTTRTTSG